MKSVETQLQSGIKGINLATGQPETSDSEAERTNSGDPISLYSLYVESLYIALLGIKKLDKSCNFNSFIEASFTCLKVHPQQACNSMIFTKYRVVQPSPPSSFGTFPSPYLQ